MSEECPPDYANDSVAVIRFKICDEEKPYLVSDAQIEYLLLEAGDNVSAATLTACEQKVRKLADCVDSSVGQVRVAYSQRYKQAKEVCEDLRKRSGCGLGEVFVGGRAPVGPNGEEPKGAFEIGLTDNPNLTNWTRYDEED